MTEEIEVPYAQSVHGQKEIEAVVKVLRSSTQAGEHVELFEDRISDLFEKQHGVMVNSGSSANYLAVEIADVSRGAEVITPALTFSTTLAPIIKNRLRPVLVDVDPETFNVRLEDVRAAVSDETEALMIPSLIGNLPDWKSIGELAAEEDLVLIEDSADTLGARLRGSSTGRWTDISTTSFYGSHIINCAGNGGMLCVDNSDYAENARVLRGWGRSSARGGESEEIEDRFDVVLDGVRYDSKFVFDEVGYNFMPSEIGAAFGLVQLDRLDDNIERRQEIFRQHQEFFGQYESLLSVPREMEEADTAWLAYPVVVRERAPFSRTDIQVYLEENNIQTRPIFTGNVLRQPGFRDIDARISSEGYPGADSVMRGGLLVGCHHGMSDQQVAYLHDTVAKFVNNKA